MRNLAVFTFSAVLAGFAPQVANADAIYGCWTNGAETLTVEYERVVTGSGASPDAEIDRHGATFIVPEGERDAGARVIFRQLNDNQVARTVAGSDDNQQGTREIWSPCQKQISS